MSNLWNVLNNKEKFLKLHMSTKYIISHNAKTQYAVPRIIFHGIR